MPEVRRCVAADLPDWLPMRAALWPECAADAQRAEALACLADSARCRAFIARDGAGGALGFAEASVREEHINGAEASPVAFLEGVYVAPAARRQGVARALVEAVRGWARAQGLAELCSDTDLGNAASRATHSALGFEETEVVVFFRQPLDGPDSRAGG